MTDDYIVPKFIKESEYNMTSTSLPIEERESWQYEYYDIKYLFLTRSPFNKTVPWIRIYKFRGKSRFRKVMDKFRTKRWRTNYSEQK